MEQLLGSYILSVGKWKEIIASIGDYTIDVKWALTFIVILIGQHGGVAYVQALKGTLVLRRGGTSLPSLSLSLSPSISFGARAPMAL